jgi:hypothetical protein
MTPHGDFWSELPKHEKLKLKIYFQLKHLRSIQLLDGCNAIDVYLFRSYSTDNITLINLLHFEKAFEDQNYHDQIAKRIFFSILKWF